MKSTRLRTLRALGAVVIGLVLMAGVALAHTPSVVLDSIGDLGPYAPTDFPVTYNVTGDLCHSGPGNVDGVSELKLFINDLQEGGTVDPEPGNVACWDFSLPWSITGPGVYTVKVTARHGNDTGEDAEAIEVSQTTVIVTECPAAPAIAVHHMMEQGVKPGSGTWKKVVKAVASGTGFGGPFWAANACDAGYADAVKAFVDDNI